jgi:hypothetical protein
VTTSVPRLSFMRGCFFFGRHVYGYLPGVRKRTWNLTFLRGLTALLRFPATVIECGALLLFASTKRTAPTATRFRETLHAFAVILTCTFVGAAG